MTDSLIIGESIELVGAPGGVASANPLCTGAVFLLMPGFDLGAPQPVTSVIGSLLLDGSRPFGYQAANRAITMQVQIRAPTFQVLAAAREVLLREINQQTWTLRWTRDTAGALAGNTAPLPILFDCFRARATVNSWGGLDKFDRVPSGMLTLSFDALPYGRADQPVIADFPSPLSGRLAPPPPVTLDAYSSVSGAQWAASAQSPVAGGASAFWDPGISPAFTPDGTGVTPSYSKSGLAVNLAQGWEGVSQSASGSASVVTFLAGVAPTTAVRAGDQFQLAGNFLTGQNTGFEGGLGSWAASANCAVADTAAQAHTGVNSMSLTSTAAGNMSALYNVTPVGSGMPCLPGDLVYVSAWFRSAVSARQCQIGVNWYDASGNLLSSAFGAVLLGASSIADTTTGWTQAQANPVAPAGAAWCLPVAQVLAAGAASEVHYVDDVTLGGRGCPLLQSQIFTVTQIEAPFAGFVNVHFTPAAAVNPALGNTAVQTGPPKLSALTFWAGFGSSAFYRHWSVLGGRVTFSFTLTDTYGTTLSFSKTAKVTGSAISFGPRWQKIRVPVPYKAGFDYANVASYTLTVTNRGTGDLRYSQLYVSSLIAVPVPVTAAAAPRAACYELAGLPGSARAPVSLQFQQSGSQSRTQYLRVAGAGQWLCPLGVTSVSVYAVGGGGAGGAVNPASGFAAGGGGGGGSAANAAVAVTPGAVYSYVVGAGGTTGSTVLAPAASSFTGDSVTVTAPAGVNGALNSATGAAGGAAGTGGFAGAAGGAGQGAGFATGGGGGGSSGGSAAGGNTGAAGAGGNGGAGGAAVTDGGKGGAGGATFILPHAGSAPGGGGGGAYNGTGPLNGGAGAAGEIRLIYTSPTPTFQTLLAHRPPVTAPDTLIPFVSPVVTDVPDGTTQYPVTSLVPGVAARFAGTYTVAVAAWSWHTTTARTITVTVTQWEQQGGASYTTSAAATVTPSTLPATSDTNATLGPLAVLGEVTLPVQDIPQDNTSTYFTVAITSSDTADRFSDIFFLDTQGSTVIVQSPTGYVNHYLDEPASDRDLGIIAGSVFDRDSATSVLDRATVAGGPMSHDPDGNPLLVAWCAEGAPNVQLTMWARYWLDRTT